jgi:hypothetical protein
MFEDTITFYDSKKGSLADSLLLMPGVVWGGGQYYLDHDCHVRIYVGWQSYLVKADSLEDLQKFKNKVKLFYIK